MLSRFDSGRGANNNNSERNTMVINTDFAHEAGLLKARADALQAEIDAAIDRHGVIHRAWQMLTGGDVESTIVITGRLDCTDLTESVRAATSPPAAKSVGGRPKGHGLDYGPIAAWINATKADGTYSMKAMQLHFGINETTAKNYITRCRKRGLLDGTPATDAPAPVAAAPVAPVAAAAEPAAEGLLHGTGNTPSRFKVPKVLACTEGECEFECPIDKGHDLNRHCLDRHGRRPHTHERMPVPAISTASAA